MPLVSKVFNDLILKQNKKITSIKSNDFIVTYGFILCPLLYEYFSYD